MKSRLKKSLKQKKKPKIEEDFWVQFNRVHNKHMTMSVGFVEVKTNEKKD